MESVSSSKEGEARARLTDEDEEDDISYLAAMVLGHGNYKHQSEVRQMWADILANVLSDKVMLPFEQGRGSRRVFGIIFIR